jgi:nitrate/TMAO reductase-like tetraheme cytochrome c subunit
MSTETLESQPPRPSLLRNWVSLTGLVIVLGSLFAFVLLFMVDTMAHFSNPYVGILTYFVSPFFLFFGLFVAAIGAWRERRKLGQTAGFIPPMVVDLSRPRDRKIMAIFLGSSVLFLLVTAVITYHSYHFTESTTFCGEACHTVMKPELITYRQGSHARIGCVECHIGPGATWFVKSKLSGTYQLYATAFDKYPRPVPTPIKNLRPAQETCEQCHWPQKFVGNLERTYYYYLQDETNSPFTVRMLMKVGGGDPTHGPVGGIHWHMNVNNKVEYVATDAKRQKIPWVRVTDPRGIVTEYRVPNFTNKVDEADVRRMDCMDCHNRPAHRFKTPNSAVNLAMALNRINRDIPFIKSNAVYSLTQTYTNETQALDQIETFLSDRYKGDSRIKPVIDEVQGIYTNNFFPEMKASWADYPDNIGHKDWLGCFRCHDGRHKAADGKSSISSTDCNSCHTILAQGGTEAELQQLTPGGQKFKHPGDEVDGACNDCHTGGL